MVAKKQAAYRDIIDVLTYRLPVFSDIGVFAGLRRVRDTLEATGLGLPELSMGMSGDYRAAVAEGATILRLGTVLFGERPK